MRRNLKLRARCAGLIILACYAFIGAVCILDLFVWRPN